MRLLFKKVLNAPEKQFIMCVKDPFHKLIPFWQIQIYADKIGYKDFYADLMEHLRNQPNLIKGRVMHLFIICMSMLSFAVIS